MIYIARYMYIYHDFVSTNLFTLLFIHIKLLLDEYSFRFELIL